MRTETSQKKEKPGTYISNPKALKLNGYTAIQSISINQCDAGSLFLEDNILLFVIEGNLKIQYGKTEYEVKRNQMAFLKKDILIEYECDPENNCIGKVECIMFSLRYELVKEFTTLAELSIAVHENSEQISVNMLDKRLLKYIDSLEPYFIEPEKINGSLVKIKLLELLFYLAGMNNNILEQVLDLREQYRHNITSTVEENIMNSLSLSQLAVLSGRSLSSFRRDFLAIYNTTPSQWIREKRLEKAQELLLNTTMAVTDVCYTSGFESIAHFSRLFKSHFGYSPSEFRMNVAIA